MMPSMMTKFRLAVIVGCIAWVIGCASWLNHVNGKFKDCNWKWRTAKDDYEIAVYSRCQELAHDETGDIMWPATRMLA